jgi:hypothetical protein
MSILLVKKSLKMKFSTPKKQEKKEEKKVSTNHLKIVKKLKKSRKEKEILSKIFK